MKNRFFFLAVICIAAVGVPFAALSDDFNANLVQITKPAAEKGDAQAQWELGNAYHRGFGVPQDDAEAVKWWVKASAQGHKDASCELAASYGQITQITSEEADAAKKICDASMQSQVQELEAKAEKDDAEAQLALGKIYHLGVGVTKDDSEAVKWWSKASTLGNKGASCQLVSGYGTISEITKEEALAAKRICNLYNPQLDN